MSEKITYKAALIQMDSQADYEKNMETAKTRIREAKQNGVSLVVLPETMDYIGKGLKYHARTSVSQMEEEFGPLAKELGIYIHCGSFTLRENDDLPSNTSLVFGPDGETIARYEKIHLFDVDVSDGPCYKESKSIKAGNHISIVKTELGTLGLAICYDIRFPQMFHLMAEAGAEIFVVCANFTDPTGQAHWETLLRTRAIENGCYVLACDQCGQKVAFKSHGHSMIIDPWGRILTQAEYEETILYADIDMAEVSRIRKEMPSLNNDRKDLYTLISESIYSN